MEARAFFFRHPGLDPGSSFLPQPLREEAGCRIKSGMTMKGIALAALTATWLIGWQVSRFLIGEYMLAYPQGEEPAWTWRLIHRADAALAASYLILAYFIVRGRRHS